MSTEERLSRLGLLHLKDNPEELQLVLQRMASEWEAKVRRWERKKSIKFEGEVSKDGEGKGAPLKLRQGSQSLPNVTST